MTKITFSPASDHVIAVGRHWIVSPGRSSYAAHLHFRPDPGERTCLETFAEALARAGFEVVELAGGDWGMVTVPELLKGDPERVLREVIGGDAEAGDVVDPTASFLQAVAARLACRAAVVDAQRNLLEAIQGVRVTSTTVVQDFALESDEIRTTLEGVVKGASMLERKTNDDGVCTVVLRMPMGGKMSTSVYQASFGAADDAVSLRLLPSGSYGAGQLLSSGT